ncbi:MAG: PHP domain-containing protein [Lachnospiraceae bacterium]|nr:PHP domain-containing protein [Lachnospiraceae bacterium]
MSKELYFYETHLHTAEASACSNCPGADYVQKYKETGFAGIFVTDHFFNGNSGVPRDLPWDQMVDIYCSGYENAKAAGDKIGLDVFFGLEVNFRGDEYLIYGPDKAWLKAHPDIMGWSHEKLREEVHKIGGAMIQAHPYRDRGYLEKIRVHAHHADAFEVHNSGNLPYCDQYGYQYAKQHGMMMTSGSDIHRVSDLEKNSYGGVCFTSKIESSKDYAGRIKSAKGIVPILGNEVVRDNSLAPEIGEGFYGFITYADRLIPNPNQEWTKPVCITNENGEEVDVNPADTIDWSKI